MINRLLLSLLLIIQASTQGGPATMGGPSRMGAVAGGGGGTLSGTFHNACGNTTGGASGTCSLAVTSGDLIIIEIGSNFTSNTFTVSDAVNTYSSIAGPDVNGSAYIAQMFRAIASTTVTLTITCTRAGGTTGAGSCEAIAITPSATPTLDQHPVGGTFTTATAFITGTTGATATANEILISCFGWAEINTGSNPVAGASWLNFSWSASTISNTGCEWRNVTSTGTYQGTATAALAETGVGHIATFQ